MQSKNEYNPLEAESQLIEQYFQILKKIKDNCSPNIIEMLIENTPRYLGQATTFTSSPSTSQHHSAPITNNLPLHSSYQQATYSQNPPAIQRHIQSRSNHDDFTDSEPSETDVISQENLFSKKRKAEESTTSSLDKKRHSKLQKSRDLTSEKGKEKVVVKKYKSKYPKPKRKLVSEDIIKFIKEFNLDQYKTLTPKIIEKNKKHESKPGSNPIPLIKKDRLKRSSNAKKLGDYLEHQNNFCLQMKRPFLVKKGGIYVERSELYQDKNQRTAYIKKQLEKLKLITDKNQESTVLSEVVQNLLFLFKHHLIHNLLLERPSYKSVVDIIIYKLKDFDIEPHRKMLATALTKCVYLVVRKLKLQMHSAPSLPLKDDTLLSIPAQEDVKSMTISYIDNEFSGLINEPHPSALKVNFPANIYDQNGELLAIFRPKIIPTNLISNKLKEDLNRISDAQLKRMGSIAGQSRIQGRNEIRSAPFGILANRTRQLGLTQFTLQYPSIYEEIAPITQFIDMFYRQELPENYKARKETMASVSSLTLKNSNIFTAFTVNFDKQTHVHMDNNKFPFSVLEPLYVLNPKQLSHQTGRSYTGGYTYFPTLMVTDGDNVHRGIYMDLEEGDLLLANFCKLPHCNTKITFTNEDHRHRISIVEFAQKDIIKKSQVTYFPDTDNEEESDNELADVIERTQPTEIPEKHDEWEEEIIDAGVQPLASNSHIFFRPPSKTTSNAVTPMIPHTHQHEEFPRCDTELDQGDPSLLSGQGT